MAKSVEYENLVRTVMAQLSAAQGLGTTRLEHDVRLQGRATRNQVDVLWELVDADGHPLRVVIEARQYSRRVDQSRLHAFRSVLDDVAVDGVETRGLMVTTVGFQAGARQIAQTHGIGLVELREPREQDWAGVIRRVTLDMTVQVPRVTNLEFALPPGVDVGGPVSLHDWTDEILLGQESLYAFLYGEFLVGHAAGIGERVEAHRIDFLLDPPRTLAVPGGPEVPIARVSADYEELPFKVSSSTTDLADSVALLVLNSLSGTRAWINEDGGIRVVWAVETR